MLFVPSGNDYKWQVSSFGTSRPNTNFGTTVTPAQNSKGSYAQLMTGSAVENDVWFVLVNCNSNSSTATNRDTLLDIGIDEAGGTSYTVKIPDLLVSDAAPYNIGSGGIWYAFPLFIKAGSSIAARASVNNATVGTLRCFVTVYGKPRHPATTRVGSTVVAFGVTSSTSNGTSITSGTASDGAWTELSGGTISVSPWWWQLGYGCDDTTMSSNVLHADLAAGDATTKKILILDQTICTSGSEQINNSPLTVGCMANVAAGDRIYGRLQSGGTADASLSMTAYGLY